MSKYLSDQGERTRLLDYLVSLYENVADFSGELLAMELPTVTSDEMEARKYRASTLAMDIQADWFMVEPMLADIYNELPPVDIMGPNA